MALSILLGLEQVRIFSHFQKFLSMESVSLFISKSIFFNWSFYCFHRTQKKGPFFTKAYSLLLKYLAEFGKIVSLDLSLAW